MGVGKDVKNDGLELFKIQIETCTTKKEAEPESFCLYQPDTEQQLKFPYTPQSSETHWFV